jgi:hypothetical protein
MLIESGSSLQAFATCPKLYEFKYVKLLEPKSYSSALGFGTFIHAEVERALGGRIDSTEVEFARLTQSKQDHAKQIAIDRLMAEDFFSLWKKRWQDQDGPFSNGRFEWLSAEKEWGFDVGKGFHHVGKSDALAREKESGAIFLYELKTAADRDREGYVHKLEIDRQVSSNMIAMRKAGIDVQGVLYDIVWKPGIRRLVGRKTKPDETPEEFAKRMVATAAESLDDNFERRIVYRSDRFLGEHGKDLQLQFMAVEDAHARGFFRNTGACHDYGLCPFFSACIEQREELESLYALKDRKLPELSKEIQCKSTTPPTS